MVLGCASSSDKTIQTGGLLLRVWLFGRSRRPCASREKYHRRHKADFSGQEQLAKELSRKKDYFPAAISVGVSIFLGKTRGFECSGADRPFYLLQLLELRFGGVVFVERIATADQAVARGGGAIA